MHNTSHGAYHADHLGGAGGFRRAHGAVVVPRSVPGPQPGPAAMPQVLVQHDRGPEAGLPGVRARRPQPQTPPPHPPTALGHCAGRLHGRMLLLFMAGQNPSGRTEGAGGGRAAADQLPSGHASQGQPDPTRDPAATGSTVWLLALGVGASFAEPGCRAACQWTGLGRRGDPGPHR
ncbi:MAG: MBL fold metallo-hydrolase [Planctomycetes bacterium]|nr:MBL fold metallo-hydrolase [Planctomycetota bacterium]